MTERYVRIDFSGICSFVSEDWSPVGADTATVGPVDVLLIDARASSLGDSLCEHFPAFTFPIHEGGVDYFQGIRSTGQIHLPYLTFPRLDDPLSLVGLLPLKGRRITFAITTDTDDTPQALAGGVLKESTFNDALDLDLLMEEAGAATVGVAPEWRASRRVEGLVGARIWIAGGMLGIDSRLVERKFRQIEGTAPESSKKKFAESIYWKFPVSGPIKYLVVQIWSGESLEFQLYFATGSSMVRAPRFGVSNLCSARVLGDGPPELSRDIAVFYDLAMEVVPTGQRLVALEPVGTGGVQAGTDSCPPVRQTWA